MRTDEELKIRNPIGNRAILVFSGREAGTRIILGILGLV